MWTTKKKLKRELKELELQHNKLIELYQQLSDSFAQETIRTLDLSNKVDMYHEKYPFELGQIVFDVQLRSDKGRFTKTKPSREYSMINEVTVEKKNYFNLVDRYHNNDVFIALSDAEKYLDDVCVN